MALIGLVNLAERLLNQTAGQTAQEPLTTPKPAKTGADNGAPAATQDQFTPSAQNTAQAAGLFTVSQFTLFSAAADFLLAQSAAPQTNQAKAPAPAANFTALPARQTSAATNTAAALRAPAVGTTLTAPATANPNASNANNPGTVSALPQPIAATATPANALAATTAPTTSTANIQDQLQSLNSALAALGLSTADIRKIDSIASLIHDFNPTAFTSLVYQLEALAQRVAPQTRTNPAATANANAVNANTANANTANTNGGGFQIQELLIRFSSVQAQGTLGSRDTQTADTRAPSANAAAAFGLQAFNLQVEEVQLSLTNKNGQTVRVQAPAQAVNANPPAGGNQAPAQTRAATA